jgi:hypothetical protein
MYIDDGARPGAVRLERRWCELQRPMSVLCEVVGRLARPLWLGMLCHFVEADRVLVGGGFVAGAAGVDRSVPVVVLVTTKQFERLGGLGEDADGSGAAHIHRVGVTLAGEDVGYPVHGGFEPDRIAGGGAGNDQLQTMLGGAAEPHEALLRS